MFVARSACFEDAKRAWQQSGRPIDQLRFETFSSSGRFASETFKVKIPRLEHEIDVQINQTMLEALESAGIDMIFDCRKGECRLCALPILETDGIVDHRGKSRKYQALHLRIASDRRQHHG